MSFPENGDRTQTTTQKAMNASSISHVARTHADVEHIVIASQEMQHRLSLLNVLAPAMFIVSIIALPAALITPRLTDMLQVGAALFTFTLAFWATLTRRAIVGALALIVGIQITLMSIIYFNSSYFGQLDVRVVPLFFTLCGPIVIAGFLLGPRVAMAITGASMGFTYLTFTLTPHTHLLQAALHTQGGQSLSYLPLMVQLSVGFFTTLGTRSFWRMQRELGSLHVAYERERELDHLKNQFISSVNHELRTPIMAIQGYFDLARELGIQGHIERQQAMLTRGMTTADDLAQMVRTILDTGHIDIDPARLNMSRFALAPVVQSAVGMLDPRMIGGQGRHVHLAIDPDLSLYADEGRVRQILVNLLTNATKYSPSGTPITVSARRIVQHARRQNTQPAQVEIMVQDAGFGIPPTQATLIFERFVRLERDIASATPGTGVGLALCRSLVEVMGGKIWVESTGIPGEGATFAFTLLAEPSEIVIMD